MDLYFLLFVVFISMYHFLLFICTFYVSSLKHDPLKSFASLGWATLPMLVSDVILSKPQIIIFGSHMEPMQNATKLSWKEPTSAVFGWILNLLFLNPHRNKLGDHRYPLVSHDAHFEKSILVFFSFLQMNNFYFSYFSKKVCLLIQIKL